MDKRNNDIPVSNYWQGKGRKLIIIPNDVLSSRVGKNALLKQLYLTEMGFYPAALQHYTLRANGCPEVIIIICVDGKGKYEAQSGCFEVLAGQFFILPPNQMHSYMADPDEPWSIFWMRISGTNKNKFCAQPLVKKLFKPAYTNRIQEINYLFDDIYQTLEKGYSLQHLGYSCMTLQRILSLLIYRTFETAKEEITLISKVILHMKEHVSNPYSLRELAGKFDYSNSRFSKLFKDETGYSPVDYFIRLKIQECCQLLDTTTMKIYEVALHVGYLDPYHFSKLFKKVMHVSPAKYRKLKKG